jgi:hypothetical protein
MLTLMQLARLMSLEDENVLPIDQRRIIELIPSRNLTGND